MSSEPGSDGSTTPEKPEDESMPPKTDSTKPRDGTPEERETQKKARWRAWAKTAFSWALRTAVTWWFSQL
ncbi:hypothetical protein ACQPZF_29835 [Actinosynnema sp. CS-041913]|uniref:hypothetical protein n=1 Tax=Actinosynnema sp. CS-041913 TaxID=3239917 RepID=UPI003D8AF91D